MNLTEWAHAQGIHVTTAYRWYREGKLPVPARRVGRLILASPGTAASASAADGAGLYARVSSHDQKAGLDRQVARLTAWAAQAGLRVVRAGVGSGMDGARARARRLLAGPAATVIVVEHRGRLTQMASNAGLAVIAADPAYTSRWGREHWLAPLQDQASPVTTGHHAAAVVIGRRALGHRARRRAGVTGGGQRTSRRRAAPGAPVARQADRNGRPREAQRQPPPWRKTATARRPRPLDQATQDRSGPPASQDYILLAQ